MTPLTHEDPVPEWFLKVLGRCRVIGPTGVDVHLTPLQKSLVTRLALSHPSAVSVDGLIDAMWPSDPPRTARAALHNQVSRLRSATIGEIVLNDGDGYRLGVPTDIDRLTSAVRRADALRRDGRFTEAYELADAVLVDLDGEHLDGLHDAIHLDAERRGINEARHSLEVVRLESAIETERTHWSIGEAERLAASHPLDETSWIMLTRSLEAAGRRGDALGAIDRARRTLRSSLGIDIGSRLKECERSLLTDLEPSSASEIPFSGRRDEIAQVMEAVERRDSVMVLGERGSGKSRLMQRLRTELRAKGFVVVDTTCRLDAGTIAPALHDLTEALGGDSSGWDDPVDGFMDVVHNSSTNRSVVLLVDDFHYAGPTTSLALWRAAGLDAVSVIAAVDTAVADVVLQSVEDAVVITLQPLSKSDIALMIRDVFPGIELDEARLSWLRNMSGGNPLLVRLIGDELTSNQQWSAGTIPVHPVLVSLDSIVKERLNEVGTLGRLAAEICAVAGRNARRELVERLAPPIGLQACLRHGLLIETEDGLVRFTHDVLSNVVWEQITTGRRAEIHRQVARSLSPDAVHDVAFHMLRSGGSDLVETARAVERSAELTSHLGAHLDAAALHEEFLSLASRHRGPGDEMTIRAAIRWGDSLRLAGDPRHQGILRDSVRSAVASKNSSLIVEAAQAFVQLGASSDAGEVNAEAIAVTEMALTRLDGEEWAVLAAALCVALALFGDPERVRSVFLRAESRAVSSAVRRAVLPAAYLSLGHPSDLDQRVELTQELTRLADDAKDARASFEANQLQFSNSLQLADGIGLRRALDGLRRLADETGDIGRKWEHLYCAAAVAHLDGDLDRAEELANEAYSLFSPVAPARAGAAWLSQMLIVRQHQGRLDEMIDPLSQLVAAQPEMAAWPALLAGTLAYVDRDRATSLAHESLHRGPQDFTWLPRILFASRAAVSSGDRSLIDGYVTALSPWEGLVAWQGTCAFGMVDAALADLHAAHADEDRARHHRTRAHELAERLGAPVFVVAD